MAHGKSASAQYQIGARSIANGKSLAPKSIRSTGRLLSDHSKEDISKALNFDLSSLNMDDSKDREFLRSANHF